MNVWNYEKTYKDMHLEENQVDERNEQVGDKTTELSPLTDLIKESSKKSECACWNVKFFSREWEEINIHILPTISCVIC